METWKDVVDFEAFYEVSDLGSVRAKPRIQQSYGGRTWARQARGMTPTDTGRYMVVTLSRHGKSQRKYVHDLVLTAFKGLRPLGAQCCHGIKGSKVNELDNLRWDTPSANTMDKYPQGSMPLGEKHWKNVYTAAQIAEVKALIASGAKNKTIVEATKVKGTTVQQVRKGRQWAR